VNEFFDSLHPRSNTKVVMESSGMWYNIYECLSKRHLDERLSNPAKTRAIASAKIKTDKIDAVKLADLLRGGYIAECYIPTTALIHHEFETQRSNLNIKLANVVVDQLKWSVKEYAYVIRH